MNLTDIDLLELGELDALLQELQLRRTFLCDYTGKTRDGIHWEVEGKHIIPRNAIERLDLGDLHNMTAALVKGERRPVVLGAQEVVETPGTSSPFPPEVGARISNFLGQVQHHWPSRKVSLTAGPSAKSMRVVLSLPPSLWDLSKISEGLGDNSCARLVLSIGVLSDGRRKTTTTMCPLRGPRGWVLGPKIHWASAIRSRFSVS
tara:strand:+ start:110 stop:721 length:612 start_codon:yes stop_codon:yes gene_type:complete